MRRRRPALPLVLALTAATALASCGSDTDDPETSQADGPTGSAVVPPSAAPSPTSPSAAPSPSASAVPAVPAGAVPGEPQVLATGLEVPWDVAFLPDSTALVTERDTGRLLRLDPATGTTTEVAAVDVDATGEGGLLGVAVAPTFEQDRLVYLYASTEQDNRVLRAPLAPDGGSLGEQEVVLDGIPHFRIHNGGRITFGPDGLLHVATGDAGDPGRADDPDDLAGKVLRLQPDGTPAGATDGSPVLTLGHRNVQGLAFDAEGRLLASEFGPDVRDEVNLLQAGEDYGWPQSVGADDDPATTDPLLTWDPAEAAPSGAAVAGDALYVAALRGQRLWRVPLDGSGGVLAPEALLVEEFGRLRHVALAPDGSLWLLTSNADGRGEPGPDDDRVVRLPLVPQEA